MNGQSGCWRSSREGSERRLLPHLYKALVCAFTSLPGALSLSTSLAATAAKTAPQLSICSCCYCVTQWNYIPYFCCSLVPFPCAREVFCCCFFLLLERLRCHPQHPRTRMKMSMDLQVLISSGMICLWMFLAIVYTFYSCPWTIARTIKIKATSCFQTFGSCLPCIQ